MLPVVSDLAPRGVAPPRHRPPSGPEPAPHADNRGAGPLALVGPSSTMTVHATRPAEPTTARTAALRDQRQRREAASHVELRYRVKAHAIARAIERRLSQFRVAMAPGTWSRLLVVVHLSSERTVEPVRQDSSFAEKQESHPALLLVVQPGRDRRRRRRARFGDKSSSGRGVSSSTEPARGNRAKREPSRVIADVSVMR